MSRFAQLSAVGPAGVRRAGAGFTFSGRFFLRFVPLAPDLPAVDQAALALEGLAPFPAAQLYWGCWIAPDRASALVYAAHRRRFSAAETADWEGIDLAVPDVLPLLGASPGQAAVLVVAGELQLAGVAPTFLETTPRARREGESLVFEAVEPAGAVRAATTVAQPDQDALDLRDRAFLDRRRRERRQGEFIWKVLRTGLHAALLALVFEAGALGLRLLDRLQQSRLAAQAPVVARLETAHGLASRIDELTHRRLRFFEMLVTINQPRPRSIQFTRTGISGRNGLEIEAQTGSADDVSAYEAALRNLPALEKVEVRDLPARDGVTTFGLTVAFRADGAPGPGGAP